MPPKPPEKKVEKVYSDVNVCWKRDKEAAAAATSAGQLDEETKTKLLLQIGELENRTNRLANRCDIKDLSNQQVIQKISQTPADQKDITEYLTKLFQGKDQEVPGLKKTVKHLTETKEADESQHADQLESLSQAFDLMKAALDARHELLASKFLKMKSLEEERLDVEKKISELKTTLKDREKQHIEFLYQKDRTHEMECQFARRQMDNKIKEVEKECKEAETKRMKITTMKTMEDSAELYEHLSVKVQPQIGRLVNSSIALNKENDMRESFLDVYQDYTEKVKNKNAHNIKTFRRLLKSSATIDDEIAESEGTFRGKMDEFERLTNERFAVMSELDRNSEKMATMKATRAEIKSTLTQTKTKLTKVNTKNWKMWTCLNDACSFLDKFLIHLGHQSQLNQIKQMLAQFADDIEQVDSTQHRSSDVACCSGVYQD